MADGSMNESGSLSGGVQGMGPQATHAAGGAVRLNGRGPITAESFRLLTARLRKSAPLTERPSAAGSPADVEGSRIPAAEVSPPAPRADASDSVDLSVPDIAGLADVVRPDPVGDPPAAMPIGADQDDISTSLVVPSEPGAETGPPGNGGCVAETAWAPAAPPVALPEFQPFTWVSEQPGMPMAEEPSPAPADTRSDPAVAIDPPAGVYAVEPVGPVGQAAGSDRGQPAPADGEPATAALRTGATEEPSDRMAVAAPAGPPIAISEPKAAPHESEPATPGEVAASPALPGRVVDAMLKTIQTAIYAKPTPAERAAFLREIANLMEQEGSAGNAAAPAPAQGMPAAAGVSPQPSDATGQLPGHHGDGGPDAEPGAITEALADRLGPTSSLLKARTESADPFAEPPALRLLEEPRLTETAEADEESGELALTLLDMMSGGSGAALPQERTLAADTLLRILPRIPVRQLLAVVERIAIMESPPPLLVARLIRDPRPEVVAPLVERCSHISDQDLMNATSSGEVAKLRMMARRRVLSQVLSDYLIASGDATVLLTLIRNPGAALSHDAFYRLAELGARHHALLAPLATRADLPPPVAFELFWHLPPELRRFIFSRFLTDSETLNRILRITLATHGGECDQAQPETRFPPREAIDSAIALAASFRLDEAARQLAAIGGIERDTALRILSDRDGEPLMVLLKAMGYPRSGLDEVISILRRGEAGLLRADRKAEELQAVFDGLSFNKARILLTYWDWFVRKAGPYAPHN